MNGTAAPLVVSIAYNGWSLFEAGVVAEVFGLHREELGPRPLYRYRVAQAEPGPLRAGGGLRLQADGGLGLLRSADIVVLPAWRDHREPAPAALIRALVKAHERGALLMSICTGAFVLAATGLLDGKAATTHWRCAQAFRRAFPQVDLRPDVLYVDEGTLITSAGSAAGIDACLHVIRREHGAEVANVIARTMVTPPHRGGGQAQYIREPVAERERHAMSPLLEWTRKRLHEPLQVSDLARRAAMSERSFLRHFEAQVGLAPSTWLRRERVQAAQRLLESSDAALDCVAEAVGFRTAHALRAAFKDTLGTAPTHYRQRFRSPGTIGVAGSIG